jgi:ectoine hydroxylase-related dioxygenase (phytanoyl-CoA dioxygenase family)
MTIVHSTDRDWLDEALESLREHGYAARRKIVAQLGEERLARELGAVRLPMTFDDVFLRLLELPEVVATIDATLGGTAILQRQTGIVLPPFPPGETPSVAQNRFHQDFKHGTDARLTAINMLIAVDEFTRENGCTVVVPGSHGAGSAPPDEELERRAIPVECSAGSMLVFDSTLWHAAGHNVSGRDRLAVNQQFVPPYLKQQFDYVRALGDAKVVAQEPRTRQLLGWYARVVSSLDEYYRPPEERLYRPGAI